MKFSAPKTKPYEHHVQNGLAYTPSQMADLVAKGIPVSNTAVGIQSDSLAVDSIPLEGVRGVDMSDLWNAREDGKRKLREIHNNIKSQSKTE